MLTDIGEFFVGAYLKLVNECDFVDYNVRPPGGGLAGLEELDVRGLRFKDKMAYLCEVTTHIRGLQYGTNQTTIDKIESKFARQKLYAAKHLQDFTCVRFQFWSPVVPVGFLTKHLSSIDGLELVINGEYKRRVEELRILARKFTHDAKNPVFRTLQVLEHLRDR